METLEAVIQPKEKINGLRDKKRAFIILGLEGAGNYMLQNAFVEAGCVRSDRLDRIPSDIQALNELEGNIVIRKSFPHANLFPLWSWLDYRCRDAGYITHLIWIIREPNAQKQSILNRDPNRDPLTLFYNQKKFYKDLGSMSDYGSDAPDWLVITYEAFCTSEGFRRWLFEERLQLPYPEDFEVYDGNSQYYS